MGHDISDFKRLQIEADGREIDGREIAGSEIVR